MMRLPVTAAITLTTGFGLLLVGIGVSPAASIHHARRFNKKAPSAASRAVIARGKALVSLKKCNSCHAANLEGKKGFSPSLRASGALREYSVKTFERVLSTGVTNDGGHVKPPMPVFHLPAKDGAALYAYLKTQK